MEELINKYISELVNKISLKEITNKSERQILFQAFKYFDYNTNGFCNFDNFLKVNQKLGVIMPNPRDLQKIFFYFDSNKEGLINYEDFIDNIFKQKNENKKNNINNANPQKINKKIQNNIKAQNYAKTNYFSKYVNNPENNTIKNNDIKNIKHIPPYKKPFFDKIVNSLLNNEIGPGIALLLLHQGFILGDNNFMNQITIEEFIKIINDNNINLSISDIQMLFHSYELNNDGFFYYEEMFNDLINLYWNNQRDKISQRKSEEIIKFLDKKGGIKLNFLKNLISIPNNYDNFFINELNIYDANEYYSELIKKYIGLKRIMNYPRDAPLLLEDLEDIMKYISFGIQNNINFNKAINYIFSFNNTYKERNNKNRTDKNFIEEKNKNDNYIIKKNQNSLTPSKNNKIINKFRNQNNLNIFSNPKNDNNFINNDKQSLDYFFIFRQYFQNYGIITFLNLLKSFQYYDNGTKQINQKDFSKLMNDFKVNISPNTITSLFSQFQNNVSNLTMNYILFISQLIDKFINNNIINIITNIYDNINTYCLNFSGKNLNLEFFKKFFNIHNNYFFNKESDVLNNILIVFERFHYDFYEKYKEEENIVNKKDIYNLVNENIIKIDKNEFIWFYKFLNLFIQDDEVFQQVILNDWKTVLSLNKSNNKSKINNINDDIIQNTNIKNDIINNITNNEKGNSKISKLVKQTPILMKKEEKEENSYNLNIESHNDNPQNLNNDFKIELKNSKLTNNNTISNDIIYDKKSQQKEKEETNIKMKIEKIKDETPLQKLISKLKKRGIRGLMNLHKEFILSCKDLSIIPYDEFVKVLSYQRLSLSNDENENIFKLFSEDNNENNLDFTKFIRAFKKVLNEKRLSAIENIFSKLDINGNDNVLIDDIKLKFNAKDNIMVVKGEKDEEEILCEFLDCFDLNYNLLITKDNQEDNNNMVNFEEFANFYEYVSFLYENDDDFIQLINNSWKNIN